MNAMGEMTNVYSGVFRPIHSALAWIRIRYEFLSLICIPLILCAPLLRPGGLYEFGDANFPLNRFPIEYFLPWQSTSDGGVDNVLIGLPRFAYYGLINLSEVISPTLQFAQWLWYSGLLALGTLGAFLLARRLGTRLFAIPVALFWSLNLWSYDRISQGPLFLAYQALPLVLYLLIEFIESGDARYAILFALSTLLETPSLQISYLAVLACAGVVAYYGLFGSRREVLALRLLVMSIAVVVANAYFIVPLIADVLLNSQNSLHLVSSNFSNETFLAYSRNATPQRALQLAAFFYSTFVSQPVWLQVLSFCPIILAALLLSGRRAWRRRSVQFAVAAFVVGIWLVCGAQALPPFYFYFRAHVPGLSSFVEPDYFTPIIILAYFGLFALCEPLVKTKYRAAAVVLIWLTATLGVCTYMPWARSVSGFQQAPIPNDYVTLSRTKIAERVFLLPTVWVAKYTWSPYTINGFNASNAPGPFMGPYMLEWVSEGSREIIDQVSNELAQGDTSDAVALLRILATSNVAVSLDQLDAYGRSESADLDAGRLLVAALPSQGGARSRHLLTALVPSPLPMIGLSQAPVAFTGRPDELGGLLAAMFESGRYLPIVERSSLLSASVVHDGDKRDFAAEPTLQAAGAGSDSTFLTSNGDGKIVLSAPNFTGINDCLHIMRAASPLNKSSREIDIAGRGQAYPCTTASVPLVKPRPKILSIQMDSLALAHCHCMPQYVFSGSGRSSVVVPGLLPDSTQTLLVPRWATRIAVTLYGLAHDTVRYKPIVVDMLYAHNYVLHDERTSQCHSLFQSLNVLHLSYSLGGRVSGRCAVVLRQSYSSLWHARVRGISGVTHLGDHSVVDGYANGWIVEGNGRFAVDIFNALSLPFLVGLCISMIGVLVSIALWVSACRHDGIANVP